MADIANYMDGKSATITVVNIALDDEALIISERDGNELSQWPLDDVRYVALPTDGAIRRLRCGFDRPDRLTLTSAFVPDWIIANCPNLKKTHPGIRRYWKKVAFWGGGAAASLVFVLLVVILILAKQFAVFIPERIERQIGDKMLQHFASTLSGNPEQPFCVKNVAYHNLSKTLDNLMFDVPSPSEIQFHLVDTKLANAFALPGGHIVLTSGLVQEAETQNELIGVLAHEIGHVQARHPMQGALEDAAFSIVLGLIIGDVTGGFVLTAASEAAIEGVFSRDMEREADAFGIDVMNAQNFDVRPLGKLLERLSADNVELEQKYRYFLSHPVSRDRALYIEQHATGEHDAMTDKEWQQVKDMTCK